jgi:hypothetical protein
MKRRHLLLVTPLLCWAASVNAGDYLCPSISAPSARRLIETTCRDVEQRLDRVPGATVRTGTNSFVDSRFGCTREGCVVKLTGSFSSLKGQVSPDSWLAEYLEAKGWFHTLSHDADGPDGTVYALHQPGALCIVEGKWNHWHDDNGESHTGDAYEVTVSCGGAERIAPAPPE